MKPIKNLIILLTILILSLVIYLKTNIEPKIIVPEIEVTADRDWDWISDNLDIVEGARWEVANKTNYRSAYYVWGFPPKNEGVCTDVVWRALQNAGYDLKSMIDWDIQKYTWSYKRVAWKPDPNIDFRRVPNLQTYLEKNATKLTTKVIAWDVDNLVKWQAWDIVIFWNHWSNKARNQTKALDHTAIISDKRNIDWIPYMIHNAAPVPREDDWLVYWDTNVSKIIGHYRLKY